MGCLTRCRDKIHSCPVAFLHRLLVLCSLFALLGGPAMQRHLTESVVAEKTAIKFDSACLAHPWVVKCERAVVRSLQPPDGRLFSDDAAQALVRLRVETSRPAWFDAGRARCGDAQAPWLVGVVELQV